MTPLPARTGNVSLDNADAVIDGATAKVILMMGILKISLLYIFRLALNDAAEAFVAGSVRLRADRE